MPDRSHVVVSRQVLIIYLLQKVLKEGVYIGTGKPHHCLGEQRMHFINIFVLKSDRAAAFSGHFQHFFAKLSLLSQPVSNEL